MKMYFNLGLPENMLSKSTPKEYSAVVTDWEALVVAEVAEEGYAVAVTAGTNKVFVETELVRWASWCGETLEEETVVVLGTSVEDEYDMSCIDWADGTGNKVCEGRFNRATVWTAGLEGIVEGVV